ncbi:MAG: hypothetical protein MZV70_50500 [Desulfobacterales bacterium]|nr:hypothetical protein [Desulfobacterales bacterium]
MFDRRLIHNFDWGLLLVVLLLAAVGLTTVYSAVTADPPPAAQKVLFYKQIIWFCARRRRHDRGLFLQLPAARALGAPDLHRLRADAAGRGGVRQARRRAPGAGWRSARSTCSPPS